MLTVRKIENCEYNNHLKTLYAEIVTVNILVNILIYIYSCSDAFICMLTCL